MSMNRIIDVHAHYGHGAKDLILEICEFYNIYKIFVSTLDAGSGAEYYPSRDTVKKCNEMTAGFMRERPKLVEGLCYLNPANGGCLEELKRCVEGFGMRGIKLWVATYCDDERVFPIAEAAVKYGIPILAHTFFKEIGQLEHESRGFHAANLGKRYPELKLIAAHTGANVYHTVKSVKDVRNVCVDFSGSFFRRDDIEYTVRHLGAERVLFGSDMPGVFEDCLGKAETSGITDGERELIYYKNACRLFGLGDV